MHWKIKSLLLLMTVSLAAVSQKTILWKVTNPNTNHTSYIMGTNHAIGSSFVDSFPVIRMLLESSNVFVSETIGSDTVIAGYYNRRTVTTSLLALLGEKDSSRLAAAFKNRSSYLNKMTPGEIMLYLGAGSRMTCTKYRASDTVLIDDYLKITASRSGKELHFLESDSFQLAVIKRISDRFKAGIAKKMVPFYLNKLEKNATAPQKCSDEDKYASFDVDYRYSKNCRKRGAKSMLVTERNAAWMQQLQALVAGNNCFIAVGLGHLKNKCGLIQQFRKLGYTVEPVALRTDVQW